MSTVKTPSVWVDDSHAVLRRGLVACLEQDGCRVLGESAQLDPPPPVEELDALVLEAGDAAVAHTLEHGWPDRLAVVATVRLPADDAVRTLAIGGVGAFLDRDHVTPAGLAAAVRGGVVGSVSVPRDAFGAVIAPAPLEPAGLPRGLRPRERDVLRLLAEGLDTRTISGTLSYSERTVKNIVHDVMVKLDCRTRAQAVGVATRQGLI